MPQQTSQIYMYTSFSKRERHYDPFRAKEIINRGILQQQTSQIYMYTSFFVWLEAIHRNVSLFIKDVMFIIRINNDSVIHRQVKTSVVETSGDYKQLLDEVFVISRIIKVEVLVISHNPYRRRP